MRGAHVPSVLELARELGNVDETCRTRTRLSRVVAVSGEAGYSGPLAFLERFYSEEQENSWRFSIFDKRSRATLSHRF